MPFRNRGSLMKVSYRPPDGDLCDISRDIRVYTDEKNPNGPLQYKKLNGTGLTNYSFNIFISDYGSDKAKFNGTMKYAGVEYEWKGFFVTKKEKEVQNPVINIPKPANLDSAATIDGLHSITPFVWKSDDSGNQKSNDQAQNFGDKMMNSVSVHLLTTGHLLTRQRSCFMRSMTIQGRTCYPIYSL